MSIGHPDTIVRSGHPARANTHVLYACFRNKRTPFVGPLPEQHSSATLIWGILIDNRSNRLSQTANRNALRQRVVDEMLMIKLIWKCINLILFVSILVDAHYELDKDLIRSKAIENDYGVKWGRRRIKYVFWIETAGTGQPKIGTQRHKRKRVELYIVAMIWFSFSTIPNAILIIIINNCSFAHERQRERERQEMVVLSVISQLDHISLHLNGSCACHSEICIQLMNDEASPSQQWRKFILLRQQIQCTQSMATIQQNKWR